MSVPFGVAADALILTPDGPVPAGSLTVGQAVLTLDPMDGDGPVPQDIVAIERCEVDHLVCLVRDHATTRGMTPGTNVWDAFDEMFRAAASLSPLAETMELTRPSGTAVTAALVEAAEVLQPGTEVLQLTVAGTEGSYFADGVLVKAALRGAP